MKKMGENGYFLKRNIFHRKINRLYAMFNEEVLALEFEQRFCKNKNSWRAKIAKRC